MSPGTYISDKINANKYGITAASHESYAAPNTRRIDWWFNSFASLTATKTNVGPNLRCLENVPLVPVNRPAQIALVASSGISWIFMIVWKSQILRIFTPSQWFINNWFKRITSFREFCGRNAVNTINIEFYTEIHGGHRNCMVTGLAR